MPLWGNGGNGANDVPKFVADLLHAGSGNAQKKTKNQSAYQNTTPNAFINNQTDGIYYFSPLDIQSMNPKPGGSAGWYLKRTGAGNRSNRVQWEHLASLGIKGPFTVKRNLTLADIYMSMAYWIDASDPTTITQSGGTVSQATDKSGLQNTVSEGTVGQQPVFQATGINGLPALSFVAANSQTLVGASTSTLIAATGYSAFFIAQVPDITQNQIIAAQDSQSVRNAQFLRVNTSGQVESIVFNTSGTNFNGNTGAGVVSLNTPFLAGAVCTGGSGTVTAYLNGVAGTPSTTITGTENTGASTFALGATTRTTAAYSNVKIAKGIIVAGPVSDAIRQQIEGVLTWETGLQSLLPNNHPYQSVRPTITYTYMGGQKIISDAMSYLEDNIFATSLTSYSGSIFAGLITPNFLPAIAKSTDGGVTWSKNLISSIPCSDDAHDSTTAETDINGYIHSSFGMHAIPLRYSVSNSPGDISAWTAKNTFYGVNENTVTYPQFFKSPNTGKLYVTYRNGFSNSGTQQIGVYDEVAKTWSALGGFNVVLDGTGASRGPYPNTLVFDTNDNIHMVWTWRDGSPANSNLYYARFDRASGQWKDINGSTYTLPITFATGVQIVASSGKRLINSCSQTIDASNVVHAAFVQDDAGGKSQIWHLTISGSTVTITQITNLNITHTNPNFPDISRPLIWLYKRALYILYTTGGTSTASNFSNPPGPAFLMSSSDNGATWITKSVNFPIQCSEFGIDRSYLAATGNVRIFGQTTASQVGPAFTVDMPTLLSLAA